MTNAAPWSVKGIDPRAREAAREAARRQGMTIGEWLNQAILANEAALAQARGEPAPESGPRGADPRLSEALSQLAERLETNDRRSALALTGLDRSLSAVAARVEHAEQETRSETGRVSDLLDELRDAQSVLLEQMRRIETEDLPALQAEIDAPNDRLDSIEGDLHMLSARALAAEAQTGEALARLDGAMSALDVKLSNAVNPERVDSQIANMRESFEANLDTMAQDVASMIAETRADIAGQIVAALGGLQPEEMNEALADVSRRLTAAERRHTQTIEAVSIEIKRLSESMDRRVRVIEARNDDNGAAELREEIASVSKAVEHRLSEMETREATAFSRMGEEVGRIAEKLDARVVGSEARSADAIEKVGEQVALMAERLSAKQDKFATEVAERIVQSEERQTGRLSQALNTITARLSSIDANGADASPMTQAMSSFEARLKAIEEQAGIPVTLPEVEPPTEPAYLDTPVVHAEPPAVRLEHEPDLHAKYGAPEPDVTPYAKPFQEAESYRRAAPLPDPEPVAAPAEEEEAPRETIYLEDIEEEFTRREEDPAFAPQYELPPQTKNLADPFADIEAEPPEDDEADLFWSTGKPDPAAPPAAAPARDKRDTSFFGDDDDFAPPLDESAAPAEIEDEDDDFLAPSSPRLGEEDDVERAVFGAALDLDAPAAKEDYLAAARRAAQANTQPAKTKPVKEKKKDKEKISDEAAPSPGLRGLTRVMLWGAAGALAAAIAGGVYAYNSHRGDVGQNDLEPRDNPKAAVNAYPPGSIAAGAALAAQEDSTSGSDVPLADAPQEPSLDAKPARAGPLDGAALTPSSATPDLARAVSASFSTLEDAAQRGDAVAQYDYGLARLASGDAQNAVVFLRRAANQNLAMAEYRLAKLYERGEGVPANLGEARRWTERAATLGNRKAMHDLGVYYARGEGAPFDEAAAFKWFLQAANYGVADSQFNLGVLYGQGRGVVADEGEALYWFSIAASGGDADARARAAMIESKLSAPAVAKVKARVAAFRAKPLVARANGDFGKRPWAPGQAMEADAGGPPRS